MSSLFYGDEDYYSDSIKYLRIFSKFLYSLVCNLKALEP